MIITLRKNGAGTALAITLAANAAAGTTINTSSPITVVAGDLISLRFLNNATDPSAQIVGFSVQLVV
jgi:hypothetical protein